MYVKYSARRQVRPSTCTTRVVHISVYLTEERSEVVCQVFSSLSQWPYGNTFHCTYRHKSAANTTTKHPHTPNSSQTLTAINRTESSWKLQILLQPKPVDKCYTTASIIHSHRRNNNNNNNNNNNSLFTWAELRLKTPGLKQYLQFPRRLSPIYGCDSLGAI